MRKLTIAINARMLIAGRLDGIGRFADQALQRIVKKHPDVDFIYFFDGQADKAFIHGENVKPIVIRKLTPFNNLNYAWYQFVLNFQIKKYRPDIFISPDGLLPLHVAGKKLAIIHDLNFAHNPKDLPLLIALYFNHYYPKSASKATRIATVSEFSKQDISKTYNIPVDKIDVIYNGVDENFKTINLETKNEIRSKFTNGHDYFLFVGSLHPRKNIGRLLLAFDQYKNKSKSDHKLVIAGPVFWGMKELSKILIKIAHKKDVIFTDRLNDSELKKIMASAFCLVYPPYFEGFGLPVIEAMRSGVPVIASNATSIPEISGDATIYFDPYKIEEIKNAMLKIASNPNLRTDLIAKGLLQNKKFSWEKTANLLWESIEKTLNQ